MWSSLKFSFRQKLIESRLIYQPKLAVWVCLVEFSHRFWIRLPFFSFE